MKLIRKRIPGIGAPEREGALPKDMSISKHNLTESMIQWEANAVDVDRLGSYHEDTDSTPYVQQRSEHAKD